MEGINANMAKISTMIIGVILGSLFVTLIALFMGHASQAYTIEYDNTTLDTYKQLDDIANITKEIKDQAEGIEEKSGILDVIGGFFSDGYQAMRVTFRSFGIYEKMTNQAVDDLQLGEAGAYVRVAFTAIALIILFIGVLISAIVKRDL